MTYYEIFIKNLLTAYIHCGHFSLTGRKIKFNWENPSKNYLQVAVTKIRTKKKKKRSRTKKKTKKSKPMPDEIPTVALK